MESCDFQEEVAYNQMVLLWIFILIRNLIWRYTELNCLLVGSGLIPLNMELQQDDRTVCCGHNTVGGGRYEHAHRINVCFSPFSSLPS